MNHFNKEYVEYWKNRIINNSDGSIVANEDIADFYIRILQISHADKVLDLGCGHGRFYPTISQYSKNIYGIDVTYDVINEASQYPYVSLVKGTAESSNFAEKSFNEVISWGVFDVVDQEKGFLEVNRILKKDGVFLVTGKNNSYSSDDSKAFIAERNAKLKDFPNHFTDVSLLIENIGKFGFEVLHAFAFKNRGDLGENKFISIDLNNIDFNFYEFVLILKKHKDISLTDFQFCFEFSETAIKKATENNFKNTLDFFKWHKKNNNE